MSRTSQDWVGPEAGRYPTLASAIYLGQAEFLRHALDVYQAAKRDLLPEPGEPWLDAEGWPWATAQEFYNCLQLRFGERLRRRAQLTGHLVEFEVEDDDDSQDDAGDNNSREAARSAVSMGHGCPAPSLPVGPGLVPPQGVKTPLMQTAVVSATEAES